MNNNTNWNKQAPQNNHPAGNNGHYQAGRSLQEYNQQQRIQQHRTAMPPPQPPPPYSPMPPYQQQNGRPPQVQGPVANPMQASRRWPAQMAEGPAKQQPLVPYQSGQGVTSIVQKAKPWRRSRTMRISMQKQRRRDRLQRSLFNPANLFKNIAIAFGLMLVILFSSGAASAYAYYQSEFPQIQNIANQQISQTTHIYDRNGNLLDDLFDPNGGGRRTPVSYDQIPQVMRDAMVAAEDKTFWDNPGIDPEAILRAGVQYLQHNDQVVSGASTITQQVIKNLTNDRQITLARKITEAVLAVGLTQQYPKTKILEIYFNISPFGAQELGVESAVEDYFHLMPQCNAEHVCTPAISYLDVDLKTNKHDPLLGLARASLLAGMPQNPSNYDPTISQQNRLLALQRQDFVLNQMLSMGISVQGLGPITPDIIKQAEALTAKMVFTPYIHHILAPHFVDWVIQQLVNQIGVYALLNGGFNIRTTLDLNLEEFVENAVRRHLDKPEYQPFVGDYGPLNTVHNVNDSAVVVMSAKTGEILAMDGSTDWNSRDPKVDGNNNAALDYRSPGSSFKPIEYAAAFQMGWYPGLVLPDRLTYYPFAADPKTPLDPNNPQKTAYHPPDYGKTYHNLNSTIRLDLANSFNVPAVKTFEFAGTTNVLNMARRLGITALDDDVATHNTFLGPATALGSAGVPLIQMVGAYQVFANQGVHIPPKSILDIWDNYGHNLYHFDPNNPGGVQVISPQIAYLMTSILSDEPARAIEFSGDHILSFYDWQQADGQKHEVAAKTGTTDDFVDNWTIGYTPDIVVGVWSGNADNSPFLGNVVGITGAAPIWHSVIERASGAPCNTDGAGIPCGNYHSPYTDTTFPVPPGVIKQAISKSNGLEGTGNIDWMLDSEKPMQTGIPIPCDTTTSTTSTSVPVPIPSATSGPGTVTFCTGPAPGTNTGTPTPTTIPVQYLD
jgi:membrane peptidoglycan carboxypeptidase